ncbi:MAG: LPS export ABC transporter ATP-binding protein [Acidobacteria bacterium]|nr:LPS export ABC transporter ATP-binding protein [Acidobacteriota bacterium]TDI12024.1 MAG: LPS export ABC transporter ATP-binding protein [Acidobacteriota bacterium]
MNSKQSPITLEARKLDKAYRGRRVVNDVSLTISAGEVVGLLGPNGAGKTTTFYMIVGLTTPDSGSVHLDGEEITSLPMYLRARRGISYLPQEPSVFRKLSVEDNLYAVAETLDLAPGMADQSVSELLEEFGITDLRKSLAYTLSGGERRRLEIARSMMIKPKFILLDEPLAGIDPLAVLEIQRIVVQLKSKNIGVLITDHNVRETLKITDRAYIINEGTIFRMGTPDLLSSDIEVRKVYLGENFRLY